MTKTQADRFKEIRDTLGFTQKEFAEQLSLNQTYISAIENGKRGISSKLLKRLFELFQVSSEWLLNERGEMFTNSSITNNDKESKNVENLGGPHRYLKTPNKDEPLGEEEPGGYTPPTQEELRRIKAGVDDYKKKMDLVINYTDKFKFELEKSNPELYRTRQEALHFGDLVTALHTFYATYLRQYSFVEMTLQLPKQIENINDFSYQDFKQEAFKILDSIENEKDMLGYGNEKLIELLNFLKQFDRDEVIEDYLLQ
ncbi:helix-turn-helix domain-containing protein [Pontibacter flavimaris]|uniref:HTH cro/C1-type domain-containing protein n=1 Tax=Pontibacter flavimaris TaxID=1797110 RepID=A0A1Q5PDQ2_9BACT|nr:helix-turn-helix transcriptional regulator [Pontibacter flavimaris]OKL40272.1 hypothetical protein A3841_18275 [Pontibacter flavimaris]